MSRSCETVSTMSFGLQRDVLHAGPAVVIEIFLNLALPPALGRLVDRELDGLRIVGHHDTHQRRVLGGDILVVEVDVAVESAARCAYQSAQSFILPSSTLPTM